MSKRYCRFRVGSGLEPEVGEIETRHHHATDEAGFGSVWSGALPVAGRHDHLGMLAGFDIGAE
jgi:hypothetical protein